MPFNVDVIMFTGQPTDSAQNVSRKMEKMWGQPYLSLMKQKPAAACATSAADLNCSSVEIEGLQLPLYLS